MNATESSLSGGDSWNRFWFGSPDLDGSLRRIRIGLAVVAIWYFVSHWADIGLWLSGDGLLGRDALARFLTDAAMDESVTWHLSPLYWVGSPLLLRAYLVAGIALAAASLWVTRTRAVAVALWLAVVWLANRTMMLAGLEDLALSFGLAYLAIAPADGAPHWIGSLARRLIQLHVSFLILVTGLTMLSSVLWWDGTGVVALVAPVENRYIDWVDRLSEPWVHEVLTHGILAVALVAPLLLWHRRTRRVAWGAATLWCLVLALLSSQLLYFASVAVLLQSFLDWSWRDSYAGHADGLRPTG